MSNEVRVQTNVDGKWVTIATNAEQDTYINVTKNVGTKHEIRQWWDGDIDVTAYPHGKPTDE